MKIFLLSRRQLDYNTVRLNYAHHDLAMDPTPYGVELPAGSIHTISYSIGRPKSKLSVWLYNRLGFDVLNGWDNLRGMREADAIWTVIESEWLSASFFQLLGLLQKKPIIANSVFLAEDWPRAPRSRRLLWPKLMTRNLLMTVHSERALDLLRYTFPAHQFNLLRFGVSTRAFPLTEPRLSGTTSRPLRVYSIGSDRNRDWRTLLEAFGNDPRFELRFVTGAIQKYNPEKYGNLTFSSQASVTEQHAGYGWADVVVVSMFQNNYSGITVACEAVSMGKPVFASRTGGVETYFNDEEVNYVPVGDSKALRNAVLQASPADLAARARRAQARFQQAGYSALEMSHRYVEATIRFIDARSSSTSLNRRR